MIKRKPSWALWLMWLAIYTAIDLIFQKFYHGLITWPEASDGLKESILAATLTWLFALLRWHKAENS